MQKPTPSPVRMHPSASRRSTFTLVGGALAVGLSACSGLNPVTVTSSGVCPSELARSSSTVVVTATATSAEPAVGLPASLRSQLRASAVAGQPTCVEIVTPEGDVQAVDVTPRRSDGQIENGPNRARKVDQNLDSIADRLGALARRDSGLDLLTVIDQAVRRHPVPGTLVVISSGVSTGSPVDLRLLGWDLDAVEQAARLHREGGLPRLEGWRVQFIGLGDVAGRQPRLNPALRERLQRWWPTFCRAGGAVSCTVDPELVATAAPRSHNLVPVVPLPTVTVAEERIVLPNALLFAYNSAVVQAGGRSDLAAVVDRARRTGEIVQVVGHTDVITGTPAANRRLSQRRAVAVAEYLLELGLARDQLEKPIGVGSDGASGSRERSDPAQVSRDRKVEITFHH